MTDFEKCLSIAYRLHDGQIDKGGKPYILHPVYISTKFDDADLKCVSLLHDVIEDTSMTVYDLRRNGISEHIIQAVIAITKVVGEKYEDYIARVMNNKLALQVKIEDMKHNMDTSRINDISKLGNMFAKYEKWLPILEERLSSCE